MPWWGTILVGVLTFAASVVTIRVQAPKILAEARDLQASARSVNVATDRGLRKDIDALDAELSEQRRRRQDLEQRLRQAEHRIEKLEWWIVQNTDMDPRDINGE